MKPQNNTILSLFLLCNFIFFSWSCKKDEDYHPEIRWQPKFQSFTSRQINVTVDKNTTKIPIEIEYVRGEDIHNDFAINIISYPVAELTTAVENEHYTLKWIPERIPGNPGYPKPLFRPYLLPYNDKHTADIQAYELRVNGSKITEPLTITLYCPLFKQWENAAKKPFVDTITVNLTPNL